MEADNSPSNQVDHSRTQSIRLECEVCARQFSTTKRNRHPLVGPCGHSFCRECTRLIDGKCAKCRKVFVPVKNYALIETLEELKDVKAESKEKIKKLNATIEAMKLKLKEAGAVVEDEGIEESDESEAEEEGVEADLNEQEILELQIPNTPIPVGGFLLLERQLGHPVLEDVYAMHRLLLETQVLQMQQQQEVDHLREQMGWLERQMAQANVDPEAREEADDELN